MITFTDLLIEKAKEDEVYFKNYLKYSKIIKKEAQKFLEDVKVYLFGSILKKDEIPQDIDILIISADLEEVKKRSDALVRIRKKMDVSLPFELHFATPEEYNNWWKYFLKEKLEI